jgi:hypothetical protein
MSASGGTFGASRVIRGGANSNVQSQYYMGFWPMQQSTGSDWDGDTVSDLSGKGADATLGSLSKAEAGDNAGFLTTLAESGHYAKVPNAKWTFRFSTDSLLLFMYLQGVKTASNQSFFGCGFDATHTGPRAYVTTAGAVIFNLYHTASGTPSQWNGTTATPYATDTLHSLGFYYDTTTNEMSYYVDGALDSTKTGPSINARNLADGAVVSDVGIGGWAGDTGLLPSKVKYVHALRLPGLAAPSNLAVIMQRLHAHPQIMLRDEDLA